MKIIIGLVGEKGSGKGTFTDLLQEVLPNKNVIQLRSSDVLKETLESWNLPKTRENYQKLAVAMRDTFAPDALTQAMYKRIINTEADVVIFDGVRWETDVKMLKQFPQSYIVYVTAGLPVRYQRLKTRREKEGEATTTMDQFVKEEQAETEVLIPKIGTEADFKIINEGTLEDYKGKVKKIASKIILG